MVLGKVRPDLDILEAFVIGLEVLFSGDFACQESLIFFCLGHEFSNPGLTKSRIYHFILLL